MKIELLLNFIVPLMFLAIWALTSLLNRDSQPLPPRPGRLPSSGGSRPSSVSPVATQAELSAGSRYPASSQPAAPIGRGYTEPRSSGIGAQGRPGVAGKSGRSDEGIVILESENRTLSPSFSPSTAAGNRSSRTTPARRGTSRGRVSQPTPIKTTEPERPRLLAGLTSQDLLSNKSRPLQITPLANPIAPIGTPTPQVSQGTTLDLPYRTSTKSQPVLSSDDLRDMLASPGKLREIALLGELLQKPVALRAPRHPR